MERTIEQLNKSSINEPSSIDMLNSERVYPSISQSPSRSTPSGKKKWQDFLERKNHVKKSWPFDHVDSLHI